MRSKKQKNIFINLILINLFILFQYDTIDC
jgi:hypothetical protein